MKKILVFAIRWIRNQVRTGERLQKWFPLFEAVYTTVLGDKGTTKTLPHVRDSNNTKRYYFITILALAPLFFHAMYNQAYQHLKSQALPIRFKATFFLGYDIVIPKLVAALIIGFVIEAIIAYKRQKEIQETLTIFAIIYCLILPITTPLWLSTTSFAIAILLKENLKKIKLNPALTAWGIVEIISRFPNTPAIWQSPHATFWISMAALFLMGTNIISKKQFLHTTLGAVITVIILKIILPFKLQTAWDLLMTSTLFCATFIATDAHTLPHSPEGRVHYGRLFGILAIVFLVTTKRHESLFILLLILNGLTPIIDHKAITKRLEKRWDRERNAIKTL
jgi:Na+-transporting NADH:ubiquinone oxidoreductase subunit B